MANSGPEKESRKWVQTAVSASQPDNGDPGGGDGPQHRHGALSSPGRKDQLEQRHRVADTLLEWTQWTVAPVGDDQRALAEERADRKTQLPAASIGESAPPDVADRGKECCRDSGVNGTQRKRGPGQPFGTGHAEDHVASPRARGQSGAPAVVAPRPPTPAPPLRQSSSLAATGNST